MSPRAVGRWLRTVRQLQLRQWAGQGVRVTQRLVEPALGPVLAQWLDQATRGARLLRPRDNPLLRDLAALDATLLDPQTTQHAALEFTHGWLSAAGVREQVVAAGHTSVDWRRAPSPLFAYTLHYGADVAKAAFHAHQMQDPTLAAAVLARMLDWVARVPPPSAPGWRPYVIAVRATHWAKALYYLDRMEQLPAAAASVLGHSLAAQAWYLRTHLEHALGANHLQRDYVGLLLLSRLLTGCGEAHLLAVATQGLRRQLAVQWLEDGGHVERCPGYHAQAMLDLAEARQAAPLPLRVELDRALAKGSSLLAALVHPDGTLARFGDTSADLSPDPRRLLHALGHLQASHPQTVQLFQESGFCVLQSALHHLAVDCGPLGPLQQCGHSHADAGAFEWSVRGQRLIVDVGVPGYDGSSARPYARSAAAHNVAVADGRDHAEFWQSFRVGWRPKLYQNCRVDGVSLQLELRWTDDFRKPYLQMSRKLLARPGHLAVVDCATGALQQTVRLTLHPCATARPTATGWRIERDSGFLDLTADAATVTLEPGRVWHSLGPGEATTCLVLAGGPSLEWSLCGEVG